MGIHHNRDTLAVEVHKLQNQFCYKEILLKIQLYQSKYKMFIDFLYHLSSGDSIQGSIFLHQLQVVVEDPHVRRMLLNSKSEIVMGVFLSQRDDLTILILFAQSE